MKFLPLPHALTATALALASLSANAGVTEFVKDSWLTGTPANAWSVGGITTWIQGSGWTDAVSLPGAPTNAQVLITTDYNAGVGHFSGTTTYIDQTITGLTAGQTYTLSFWQGGNGASPVAALQWIASIGNDTFASPAYSGQIAWQQVSFNFQADSSSEYLHIANNYMPGAVPNYMYMTGVSITAAVPEPSSYALMLGGIAALGFMFRRRRAQ